METRLYQQRRKDMRGGHQCMAQVAVELGALEMNQCTNSGMMIVAIEAEDWPFTILLYLCPEHAHMVHLEGEKVAPT